MKAIYLCNGYPIFGYFSTAKKCNVYTQTYNVHKNNTLEKPFIVSFQNALLVNMKFLSQMIRLKSFR